MPDGNKKVLVSPVKPRGEIRTGKTEVRGLYQMVQLKRRYLLQGVDPKPSAVQTVAQRPPSCFTRDRLAPTTVLDWKTLDRLFVITCSLIRRM